MDKTLPACTFTLDDLAWIVKNDGDLANLHGLYASITQTVAGVETHANGRLRSTEFGVLGFDDTSGFVPVVRAGGYVDGGTNITISDVVDPRALDVDDFADLHGRRAVFEREYGKSLIHEAGVLVHIAAPRNEHLRLVFANGGFRVLAGGMFVDLGGSGADEIRLIVGDPIDDVDAHLRLGLAYRAAVRGVATAANLDSHIESLVSATSTKCRYLAIESITKVIARRRKARAGRMDTDVMADNAAHAVLTMLARIEVRTNDDLAFTLGHMAFVTARNSVADAIYAPVLAGLSSPYGVEYSPSFEGDATTPDECGEVAEALISTHPDFEPLREALATVALMLADDVR